MKNYWKNIFTLIKQHPWPISFAMLCLFFSLFGQTFYLSMFNQYFVKNRHLSLESIAPAYSLATLLAAFTLPYLGRRLDHAGPVKAALPILIVLPLGHLLHGIANNIVVLFLAYYAIRGVGHAYIAVVAQTTMAKMFGKYRGVILSFVYLGKTLAESTIPVLTVILLQNYGISQASWFALGGLLLIFVPLVLFTGSQFSVEKLYDEQESVKKHQSQLPTLNIKMTKLHQYPYLLMIILSNCIVPFMMTGLFFRQELLVEFKNWDHLTFAKGLAYFSVGQMTMALVIGPLVDHLSARKLLKFILLPFITGILLLISMDGIWVCYLFLFLTGATVGMGGGVKNSYYAETYGPTSLGTIKGIDSTFSVISTSLAPPVFTTLMTNVSEFQMGIIYSLIISLLASITYTYVGQKSAESILGKSDYTL